MRKISGLIVVFACVSSAALAAGGLQNQYEVAGRRMVDHALKDPQSAIYRFPVALPGFTSTHMVCGCVNAKNSFGGYSGFQPFVGGYSKISPDGVAVIGGSTMPPEAIKQQCSTMGYNLDC